jgi:hypothetical protein
MTGLNMLGAANSPIVRGARYSADRQEGCQCQQKRAVTGRWQPLPLRLCQGHDTKRRSRGSWQGHAVLPPGLWPAVQIVVQRLAADAHVAGDLRLGVPHLDALDQFGGL